MSIRATIRIHSANSGKRFTVAKLHVWNDERGTAEMASYRYRMRYGGKNHTGAIAAFKRDQPDGAVRLVAMVLNKELGTSPIEP